MKKLVKGIYYVRVTCLFEYNVKTLARIEYTIITCHYMSYIITRSSAEITRHGWAPHVSLRKLFDVGARCADAICAPPAWMDKDVRIKCVLMYKLTQCSEWCANKNERAVWRR